MEMMRYLLTGLIAFLGSFTQSCTGFGNAIICMALWPQIMPFRTASILEAITAFFMVVYITWRLRKSINFRLLIPALVSAELFSFLGIQTLLSLPETVLHQILGCALILLGFYFLFWSDKIKLRPTVVTGLLAGAVSGFCGGLFNIGGPPMVAYLLSVTEDKMEYNATLQAFFSIHTVSIFLMHLWMGSVSVQIIPLGIFALAGTLLGTLIGLKIFLQMSMASLKKMVYIFMFIAGFVLLF